MHVRRRTVHKSGAMLALLALALQFVLSFGHYHEEDFFPVTAAHERGTTAPAKSAPALPDDNCAICLNMAMITASALPPPIVPATPVAFVFYEFPPPAFAAPRTAPRRTYRSRDPPAA